MKLKPRIHIGFSKGGVKKTTTAVNLALRYAERNNRVLFVNLDGQCDAERIFGVEYKNCRYSSADLYKKNFNHKPLQVKNYKWKVSKGDKRGCIFVIPGNLAALADAAKSADLKAIDTFKKNIDEIVERENIDTVIFDTPPSLDINQMSGLAACTHTILPLSCDHKSCGGDKVRDYSGVIKAVKERFNKTLPNPIVILTDVDAKSNLTKSYVSWAEQTFGSAKIDGYVEHSTVIPNALNTSRAPWFNPPSGNDRVKGNNYRTFLNKIIERIGA